MNFLRILCLFAFCVASCKKEARLPELTNSGANTLGCSIDGRTFVSTGKGTTTNSRGISASLITKGPWPRISIIASQEDPRYEIAFAFNFKDTPGRYELNAVHPYRGTFIDISGSSTIIDDTNEFKTTDVHVGHVIVTYYSGDVVSGTFEFDAVNDANKLVQVRKGRFDLSLTR